MQIIKAVTILRPVEEVYRALADFQNLPRFRTHIESVRPEGQGRAAWRIREDKDSSVEWEAEIVEQVPNEVIAWQAVQGSGNGASGAVYLTRAPGDRGTEVRIELRAQPSGGKLGGFFSKLFGEDPATEIEKDLRHFKQVVETGEVVHSDASIHPGMHPARPAAEHELARSGE